MSRSCRIAESEFIDKSVKPDRNLNGELVSVEYVADEEDEIWLRMTNEGLRSKNKDEISINFLEQVMDALEKLTFPKFLEDWRQLPEIHKPCSLCGVKAFHDVNQKINCINCGVTVHQVCYGVLYIPDHPWQCADCRSGGYKNKRCVLCPNEGGIFKATNDGRFVHVLCARWNSEIEYANPPFLELPCNVDEVLKKNRLYRKRCWICGHSTGALVPCEHNPCKLFFHVTCAKENGCELTSLIEDTVTEEEEEREKKNGNKDEIGKGDVEGNATKDEDKEAPPARRDGGKKRYEPLYPSIFCPRHMDPKAKQNCQQEQNDLPTATISPKLTPEILRQVYTLSSQRKVDIDEIISYWFFRRYTLDGVPLLTKHRLRFLEEMRGSIRKRHNIWRDVVKRRRELEKVRLLAGMIVKREKHKRDQLRLRMGIVMCLKKAEGSSTADALSRTDLLLALKALS